MKDPRTLPFFVDAAAVENENIRAAASCRLPCRDLGDGDDLAGAVGETRDLYDGMDGVAI